MILQILIFAFSYGTIFEKPMMKDSCEISCNRDFPDKSDGINTSLQSFSFRTFSKGIRIFFYMKEKFVLSNFLPLFIWLRADLHREWPDLVVRG